MRLGIETLKLKRLRRTNRPLLCTPIWTASIAVPVATEGPLYDVYRSVRYDYKDPVPGKVAKVTRSGGTLKRRARLHIRYEYTVAGIPYISDNLWNNSTCVEDTTPLNHLHPGDNVTVFVERGQPKQVVLDRTPATAWQWLLGFLILLLPFILLW